MPSLVAVSTSPAALQAPAAVTPKSTAAVDPHADFLSPAFDPNAFAHRVLEQAQLEHATTDTVSSALGRLNYGVQDLSHQLRQLVQANHPSLTLQASSLTALELDLSEVRSGLGDVQQSVKRLNDKVAEPHNKLDDGLRLLERVRRTAQLARRAHRFVVLVRRLNAQMADVTTAARLSATPTTTGDERSERATAEAALTLAELGAQEPRAALPPRSQLTRSNTNLAHSSRLPPPSAHAQTRSSPIQCLQRLVPPLAPKRPYQAVQIRTDPKTGTTTPPPAPARAPYETSTLLPRSLVRSRTPGRTSSTRCKRAFSAGSRPW